MSEYWKSLPRKFCGQCKCWFADNKASIQFHEKGKRHLENVEKQINDIQKKAVKDFKKIKEIENTMEKIEKAALAAYKKDMKNNPKLTLQHEDSLEVSPPVKKNSNLEPPKNVKKHKPIKVKSLKHEKNISMDKSVPTTSQGKSKKWYEAVTDEGYKYYWNVENSESCWEVPEEGYLSLEEQGLQSQETPGDIKDNTEVMSSSSAKDSANDKSNRVTSNAYGPQPKVDPYGKWVTVDHRVQDPVDLQLPKPSENIVEAYIAFPSEKLKLKFEEKVIGQLPNSDPNEEVTFKKRKFNGLTKRNVRQRTTDD